MTLFVQLHSAPSGMPIFPDLTGSVVRSSMNPGGMPITNIDAANGLTYTVIETPLEIFAKVLNPITT